VTVHENEAVVRGAAELRAVDCDVGLEDRSDLAVAAWAVPRISGAVFELVDRAPAMAFTASPGLPRAGGAPLNASSVAC
jgi:hypothetical protein